jgi:hypothetical protein
LAQVAESAATNAADASSATPNATPTDIPATGQRRSVTNPAAGAAQPVDTPATGRARPLSETSIEAKAGVGPTLRIGTITIDQSGTGRLQQVVEAVRVQDVEGLAILIYTQSDNPTPNLPPNLDPTVDPVAGAGARPTPTRGQSQDAAQPDQSDSSVPAATQPGASRTAPQNPAATAIANGIDENVPVAGGVIRLMTDGTQEAEGASTAAQGLPSAEPPLDPQSVPQNSAVPAGGDQPVVR